MKLNNNDDSHNSGLNLLIYNMLLDIGSHPAWVCGLKHSVVLYNQRPLRHTLRGCVDWNLDAYGQWCRRTCHTLRGCVDWNFAFANGIYHEQESHPAWVCGLKHYRDYRLVDVRFVTPCVGVWIETQQVCPYKAGYWCHTLRGCVDWNPLSMSRQ